MTQTQTLPNGGSQWQPASCPKDAINLHKTEQTAATLVLMAEEIPAPPPYTLTLVAFILCYSVLKAQFTR